MRRAPPRRALLFPLIALLLVALAGVQWWHREQQYDDWRRYSRWPELEEHWRGRLQVLRVTLGEDAAATAVAHWQLGQAMTRDHDRMREALHHYDLGVAGMIRHRGAEDRFTRRARLERANTLRQVHRLDDAEAELRTLLAENLDDQQLADTLGELSSLERFRPRYPLALQHVDEALQVNARLDDPYGRIDLLRMRASILCALHRADDTRRALNDALALHREHRPDGHPMERSILVQLRRDCDD